MKASRRRGAGDMGAAGRPATGIALASWSGSSQGYDAALLVVSDVSGSMKEGVPGLVGSILMGWRPLECIGLRWNALGSFEWSGGHCNRLGANGIDLDHAHAFKL